MFETRARLVEGIVFRSCIQICGLKCCRSAFTNRRMCRWNEPMSIAWCLELSVTHSL